MLFGNSNIQIPRSPAVIAAAAFCLFLASCGGSTFTGGSKSGTKKPAEENALPLPSRSSMPIPEPSTSITETGTACIRGTTNKVISLSVQGHRDSSERDFGESPRADIMASAVATFDRSSIGGNVLPVRNFAIDDVAIIVQPGVTPAQLLPCNGSCGGNRTISIPRNAILIYNAGDPNFASGKLDSEGNTTYAYQGRTIAMPANQDHFLRELRDPPFGMQLVAHNNIQLNALKTKGFVDANGNVSFRVLHVAHGFGFLNFDLLLRPCARP